LKPIQLFCAAFIYLSGFVACAQNPLRVEKLPDLKPGDTREYADRLMTVPCRQWTTIETNKDGYLVSQCKDLRLYSTADTFNAVKIVRADGTVLVEFKPFSPSLSFPMYVGKQWSGRYKGIVNNGNGRWFADFVANGNLRWEGDKRCEVKSVERLRVAGVLTDAFRIECSEDWKVNFFIQGKAHSTSWYAPGIGLVKGVHSDNRWDYVLTNYRNQQR
jgi:hypothetical protein